MKIKGCHCEQCRAKKKTASKNYKRRIKSILNTRRRRAEIGEYINFYWA